MNPAAMPEYDMVGLGRRRNRRFGAVFLPAAK
jgi:hypothetical protein